MVVAIGVLTCLLYLVAVMYQTINNNITYAEWDLKIVTLSDYSVELDIDEKGYSDWLDKVYHAKGGDYSKNISPGLSLKRYMIYKIEKQLTKELKVKQ